ncbi:MAG: cyclic nucleotide-binding domain-containing protein [Desulfobacula sp.]|nr:cyclic nucleotide-binding domain-containing protein [Desulfobacula sp.]
MNNGYMIKIAQTQSEIESIRNYSDRVFKNDGVTISGIDNTDLSADTKIFYAIKENKDASLNEIWGTIRYTMDSEKGLPFENDSFLRAHTPGKNPNDWHPIKGTEHYINADSLRSGRPDNHKLVNYGMLAIDIKHRVAARLYEVLMKLCVVHSIKKGAGHAIITVNHAIEKTMEKFGFARFLPERLYAPGIGNYIVVMTADLTSDFFSRIDLKLPQSVSVFTGSEVFRIFPRHKKICSQGDRLEKKVFLIVSGSVRVEVSTSLERKRIALIGPGEIFGEMALIDNLPRSADVICNHRHVILQELTNLNETIISQTPKIFFEFASMLSQRIRTLNKKVKTSASFTPEKCGLLPLPESLTNFIRQQEPKEFLKSELICRQGDHGDGMYLVNKGKIAISIELPDGSDLLIGMAEAGSLVGEMALLQGEHRSATMTACEVVTAIEIKKADLSNLISSDWRVGHFLLRTIINKLRLTDKMIASSIMIRPNLENDFKQKLLSIPDHENFIDAFHDIFGGMDTYESKTVYDINWICDELGLSAKSVTPWFGQLQKQDVISIDSETGAICVLDSMQLGRQELLYDLTA